MLECQRRKVHCLQGEVVHVAPAWQERLASIGIAPGSDWTQVVGERLVSTSLATKCYRTPLPDDGGVIYYKRYVYPPRFWLEFWMRPGKSAVECWAYSRLKALGIETLEIVGFGERRAFGMLLATFIATREVPDSVELEDFARETWPRMPRQQRDAVYRQVSEQLVEQMRVAHAGGFFHHDLKWRNLLLRPDGEGGYRVVWIDAPRASRMRFRERRGVITDLSGLARIAVSLFSKYRQMRFLHRYLGPDRRPGEAKQLFRDVAAHLGRRKPKPFVVQYLEDEV